MLQFLLLVSALAFGLDLFHMSYHLTAEPSLWQLPGVPSKFLSKCLAFLIPTILLLKQKVWRRWLVLLLLFLGAAPFKMVYAASTSCQHARELLSKSGVAHDASENLFGQIKVKPPYGSFPQDMDKITWWGKFRPFEFWESPEFEAVWINPQGQEVTKQKFRGKKCSLAKTSIQGESQPRGEFQGGMWNVIVTCDDYLIDKQTFAVLPAGSPSSAADSPQSGDGGAMIWAKDKIKD